MSAINVSGADPLEAWREGARQLVNTGGECINLFTTIDFPVTFDSAWLTNFSARRLGATFDSLADVVGTVFPYRLQARVPTRPDLYQRYLAVHDRAKAMNRNHGAWGTYFERLIRFPPTGINQLERAIQKLQAWPRSTTGLVFHLSSPAIDAPRTRGGPCWQFGEILWEPGDRLSLSVTYRNHDFLNKSLGNFIALGKLLDFVCSASAKTPGKLYCHSVHAFCTGHITRLKALAQI